MPPPRDGPTYLVFLHQILLGLLNEEQVPQSLCCFFWFQYDEAPVHFSLEVRRHLNVNFPRRWIGRGGLVNIPMWFKVFDTFLEEGRRLIVEQLFHEHHVTAGEALTI
ncbi:hypothetical protein AVEN_59819-1 [Araneus ventricosus]|uniref:DUF4817 domain-containing protein n=1 Tax=Araneus ventricosus TaxID=182803 RepID=A0A4Y2WJQ9_ARAVE|nr:hypothetical protein AVEN_21318-1 [Araneus ventricosus]GBO36612.1 hypothetical protein AVEN_59819-1 [Araneus ventricosus]